MKIQALLDMIIPDYPMFYIGQEYDVPDQLAQQLIDMKYARSLEVMEPKPIEAEAMVDKVDFKD